MKVPTFWHVVVAAKDGAVAHADVFKPLRFGTGEKPTVANAAVPAPVSATALAAAPVTDDVPALTTEDHVAEPGFWPTQNAAARSDFAGAAACASCHGGIAATHRTIPMGNAALHASDSGILHD